MATLAGVRPAPRLAVGHDLAPPTDGLIGLVELLFFAYRDFTGDADAVLAPLGFGRAHHRVLHFVHQYPGLRVADLLEILDITKQSLARVLRDLVTGGFIEQHTDAGDRRARRLHASPRGADLARQLAELQITRIGRALAEAAGDGVDHAGAAMATRRFLHGMIDTSERATVDALMARRPKP